MPPRTKKLSRQPQYLKPVSLFTRQRKHADRFMMALALQCEYWCPDTERIIDPAAKLWLMVIRETLVQTLPSNPRVHPSDQADAKDFFETERLDEVCHGLGLNAEWLRKKYTMFHSLIAA
jgi:hypothetical protein